MRGGKRGARFPLPLPSRTAALQMGRLHGQGGQTAYLYLICMGCKPNLG